ncbi:unnamed protein product [Owenia fusiformis]|uniref:Secreted protein n=1 Tax=Owenia fusiformis TaxID=6347 RepID=A0A8S4NBA3_OWEFU|nr:unnamed protein product [Owenia fusiformis]
MHKISVICLLLVAVVAYLVLCDEVAKPRCRRRRFRGCNLENHQCVCKDQLACNNPFPYKSRWECRRDKQGKITIETNVHFTATALLLVSMENAAKRNVPK